MPRLTRSVLLVVAVAAVLSATGCSTAVRGTASPVANSRPTTPGDGPSRPSSAPSDYLGDASAQAVGPGPARYSDEPITGMVSALTTFQDVFDDVKTDVDAIDASDPNDIITNLPTAIEPLDDLDDLPDPAKVLRADPELSAAADQAPTCQRIGGL